MRLENKDVRRRRNAAALARLLLDVQAAEELTGGMSKEQDRQNKNCRFVHITKPDS